MVEVPFSPAGTMCSTGVQSRICRSAYANASQTAQCTGRPHPCACAELPAGVWPT